ncbi:MAG: TlpA family protein disulfide reductase [Pirellulales bacterium]|nr:TlpA family protein disulfide reductase [Pirellulales bacterium]
MRRRRYETSAVWPRQTPLRLRLIAAIAVPFALLLALPLVAEDPPAKNPYLAPAELSGLRLVDFLERMHTRPASIRRRPGYTAAVDNAVERLLAEQPGDKLRARARAIQLEAWHFSASGGDTQADARLLELATALQTDPAPDVARLAKRLVLEGRALALTAEQVAGAEALLAEIRQALTAAAAAGEPLDERFLRLASAISHVVNLIPDDALAGKLLQEFGETFAASKEKIVARTGRNMKFAAGQPRPGSAPAADLKDQVLEIAGKTVDGLDFDWASYRGHVVLVDFWATWCGPCVAELPKVQALYEQYHAQGFDVVGISLDRDREDLEAFLAERRLAWVTLFEDGVERHPLAEKYGVRAIPTAILVDRDGKVISQQARGDELARLLGEIFGSGGPPPTAP